MRRNAWLDPWSLQVKGTGAAGPHNMEDMAYGESCLSYLHFAHTVCTGGRFFNEEVDEQGVPAVTDIIGACLFEVFMLADDQPGKLDTSSCGFQLLD